MHFGAVTLTNYGDQNIFVAKLDPDGNWLWATQVFGPNAEEVQALAVDPEGNCYLTGLFYETIHFATITLTSADYSTSDIFIAKLDDSGNWLWANRAGGEGGDYGYGIALDGAGYCYVTGTFNAPANFGGNTFYDIGNGTDIFRAKLDTAGNWIGVGRFGGTGYDAGMAISVDAAGDCFITGRNGPAAHFGPYVLPDQGYFVTKLTSIGGVLWVQEGGGDDIAADDSGYANVLIGSGNSNRSVRRINPDGVWLWTVPVPGYCYDLAADGSGNSYVTGQFNSNVFFGDIPMINSTGTLDIYLAKLGVDANWLWALQAGGSQSDNSANVSCDGQGNAWVAGSFYGTAIFGAHSVTNSNSYSATFIAQAGNPPPATPGNLGATAVTSSLIRLNWTDHATDESGYRVERKTEGAWAEIASLGPDETLFFNAGLSPNTTYSYRVRAWNDNGNSPYSNEASATTPAEITNPAPNWQWARQAGGEGYFYEQGWSVALDGSGNVYLTGCFEGAASFGPFTLTSSGADIFIAKLDPYGTWLWAVKAGGGGSLETATDIALDAAGNVFVTGYFESAATFGSQTLTSLGSSDIFAAKLDTNGNWLWASRAGGSGWDEGHGISVGDGGFIYVTGHFSGTAGFGANSLSSNGGRDIFLAALGAAGAWVVAAKAGGPYDDIGESIARDAWGNLYLTGSFQSSATFFTTTLTSNGGTDIFLAKFESSGAFAGALSAGGTGSDTGRDIAADAAGNVYLAGCFTGTVNFGPATVVSAGWQDIFVAKVTSDGFLAGIVRGGGPSDDYGHSLALDGGGNVYVTGYFNASADFGSHNLSSNGANDLFVAKLDPAANWLWVKQAGGPSVGFVDVGRAIAVDAAGNCLVTGKFAETTAFDATTLTSNGFVDIFVARLGFLAPPAPSGLLASSASCSSIELSWTDNSTDENGFKIERKTGSGGTWAEIGTVGADAASYQDTGLSSHTTYHYRVRAYNIYAESEYSNEAFATTRFNQPLRPQNLQITVDDPALTIDLQWDPVTQDIDGNLLPSVVYSVYFADLPAGPYELVGNTADPFCTISSGGMPLPERIFFRVKAAQNEN